MNDSSSAPPPKIPSLQRRLIIGSLRMIPVLILIVAAPIGAIQFLSSHNITVPVSILQVTLAGVLLSFLGASKYVTRPTRAYGPVWMAYSGFALLYLFYLVPLASATLHFSGSNTATFGFAGVILLLMLVPGISFAAALVTTVEDRVRPGERVRLDYPA
ncbi:MAG: hypothetical protein L3J96_04810 [Thermoplasmata archaeon]|nr:hypothetical protein [Thermoplasmata archaeon]